MELYPASKVDFQREEGSEWAGTGNPGWELKGRRRGSRKQPVGSEWIGLL